MKPTSCTDQHETGSENEPTVYLPLPNSALVTLHEKLIINPRINTILAACPVGNTARKSNRTSVTELYAFHQIQPLL